MRILDCVLKNVLHSGSSPIEHTPTICRTFVQRRAFQTSCPTPGQRQIMAKRRRPPAPNYTASDPFIGLLEPQSSLLPPTTSQSNHTIPQYPAKPRTWGSHSVHRKRPDFGFRIAATSASISSRSVSPNSTLVGSNSTRTRFNLLAAASTTIPTQSHNDGSTPPDPTFCHQLFQDLVSEYSATQSQFRRSPDHRILPRHRRHHQETIAHLQTRIIKAAQLWLDLAQQAQVRYLAALPPCDRDDRAFATVMLPSPADCEQLILGLATVNEPAEAIVVLSRRQTWYPGTPSPHGVTAILAAFQHTRASSEAVMQFVAQMRDWHLAHTADTLRPLLLLLAESNHLVEFRGVVDAAYKDGVDVPSSILSAAVQVFARHRNEAAVVYLYRNIVYYFDVVTVAELEVWFWAVGVVGRPDLAVALMDRMYHQKLPLNQPIVDCLIAQLMTRPGTYSSLLTLHEEFVEHGFVYTPDSWFALLDAAIGTGDRKLIAVYLKFDQREWAVLTDPHRIHRIVEGLLRLNQPADAFRVLRDRVKPSVVPFLNTYNLVAEAAKEVKVDLVPFIRKALEQLKSQPPTNPNLSGAESEIQW
ncbi:hypothetical protein H4R33_000438 [Dimargaris cristalligena]|nr:hypothetical protein H4R33_000438 [Dimargaris cristalligena]